MVTQKRILLVDDNVDIHKDIRKILESDNRDHSFNTLKSKVFSAVKVVDIAESHLPAYIIDSAYQGKEALEKVKNALENKQPYALAFVDIRMPPGWDGIETIKQIWKVDKDVQIVICTAYSDYSWKEMINKLEGYNNFLILKKPFDAIEIHQLAFALTQKWELNRLVIHQINTLEETVKERTLELSHAKQIAENANRLKSEFLANVSHELLTPLTTIIGFSQLMFDDKVESEKYKEYCGDILFSADHLTHMINNILDVTKIDSGEMEFHYDHINLNFLIQNVIDAHHIAIVNKNLQLHINIQATLTNIIFDPLKLEQIIFNLLSNAIKFTSKGGKIEIRVSSENDAQFRIEIIDTGIGIRKEDFDKLFLPFQQVDSSASKRYAGIGMGLALVRHMVESQGGKVSVESTYGKGSTFSVVLNCIPESHIHPVRSE